MWISVDQRYPGNSRFKVFMNLSSLRHCARDNAPEDGLMSS
jgi:hypothetical protein